MSLAVEAENARRRARYAADAALRERTRAGMRAYRLANLDTVRERDRQRRDGSLVQRAKAAGACVACGYDRHPGALQWHHVDPATKGREPSTLRHFKDEAAALAELRKCVLLCANCHWETTHGIWAASPAMIAATAALLEAVA